MVTSECVYIYYYACSSNINIHSRSSENNDLMSSTPETCLRYLEKVLTPEFLEYLYMKCFPWCYM